jgi:Kelch motif
LPYFRQRLFDRSSEIPLAERGTENHVQISPHQTPTARWFTKGILSAIKFLSFLKIKLPNHVPLLFQVMLVVGGQAPKAIRSVECYDFKEERWYQVAEMPSRRCR